MSKTNRLASLRSMVAGPDGFTHAEKISSVRGGGFNLFSVDVCEVCGAECLGANGLSVHNVTLADIKAVGLKLGTRPTTEMFWSDDHGCAACDTCCATPPKTEDLTASVQTPTALAHIETIPAIKPNANETEAEELVTAGAWIGTDVKAVGDRVTYVKNGVEYTLHVTSRGL